MRIFGTVSSREVDEFAKGLARELSEQCPPRGHPAHSSVTPKKLASVLEQIGGKAQSYRQQHKLGLYKKARLGNTFRWELANLGYDKNFVEEATQRLILHIARRA